MGEYPVDESVYGVRGLAGNVRDVCLNAYRKDGPPAEWQRLQVEPPAEPPAHVLVRGGSWFTTMRLIRMAVRFGDRPTDRMTVVGFRVCRSVAP